MDIYAAAKGKSLLACIYRSYPDRPMSDAEVIESARMAKDQITDNQRIMTAVLGREAVRYIKNVVL